jgi:hypothetical protein
MKFKITYGSKRHPEVLEASEMVDHGHEGTWIDFVNGRDELVLRVRAADVERVEHVSDGEHTGPARAEVPDLSKILA